MIIAVFPNIEKKAAKNLALGICEFLGNQGVTVVSEPSSAEIIGAKSVADVDPAKIDFMISMGGDGTILRLVHNHPEVEAPILGINLGSLGFLADIPVSEVYPSLEDLLEGRYKVEERLMLEGVAPSGETCFAVNEMVLHRATNPSLVDLGIHVDGVYLNTFSADGIILSTPSGSTAYSLAAGGPILSPELEAIAITPICPHSLSNRPLVLDPEHAIQVQYLSEREPVQVSFDGFRNFELKTGEVFRIQKAKRRFRLVSLFRHDYFSTLREKLAWAGGLRSL